MPKHNFKKTLFSKEKGGGQSINPFWNEIEEDE
jgi:hypothetical protein